MGKIYWARCGWCGEDSERSTGLLGNYCPECRTDDDQTELEPCTRCKIPSFDDVCEECEPEKETA